MSRFVVVAPVYFCLILLFLEHGLAFLLLFGLSPNGHQLEFG